jgi:hypothetical protein
MYFDGDPEHDSARRHLERVLKGAPRPRRWPWIAAIAAGGGALVLWRALNGRRPEDPDTRGSSAAGDERATRHRPERDAGRPPLQGRTTGGSHS